MHINLWYLAALCVCIEVGNTKELEINCEEHSSSMIRSNGMARWMLVEELLRIVKLVASLRQAPSLSCRETVLQYGDNISFFFFFLSPTMNNPPINRYEILVT